MKIIIEYRFLNGKKFFLSAADDIPKLKQRCDLLSFKKISISLKKI